MPRRPRTRQAATIRIFRDAPFVGEMMLCDLLPAPHDDVTVDRIVVATIETQAAEMQRILLELDESKVDVVALFLPRREIRVEVLHLETQRAVFDGQEQDLVERDAVVAVKLEESHHRTGRRRIPGLLELLSECRPGPRADQPRGVFERRGRPVLVLLELERMLRARHCRSGRRRGEDDRDCYQQHRLLHVRTPHAYRCPVSILPGTRHRWRRAIAPTRESAQEPPESPAVESGTRPHRVPRPTGG